MLLHLVLFEPKPDLTDAATRALLATIEHAARAIPTVRRFEVGRRLADGPSYLAGTPASFSFAAIVAFDDRAGLDAYLAHPAHVELGRLFNEALARAHVYDYELQDAAPGLGDFLGAHRRMGA